MWITRTLNIVSLRVFYLEQNKIRMELLLRKCYRRFMAQQEHNTMLSVRDNLFIFYAQRNTRQKMPACLSTKFQSLFASTRVPLISICFVIYESKGSSKRSRERISFLMFTHSATQVVCGANIQLVIIVAF